MYYTYKIMGGKTLQLIGNFINLIKILDSIHLNSLSIDTWYHMDYNDLFIMIWN